MKVSPPSESGFTLIELVVALALTAIISVFVLNGISTTRFAWSRIERGSATEEAEVAIQRLRDWISKSKVAFAVEEKDKPAQLLFEGRATQITAVTLSEAHAFQGGLMRYRLVWQGPSEPEKEGSPVIVYPAVFRSEISKSPELAPVVLLPHVTDLRFRYYGSLERRQPPGWHEQWVKAPTLPQFVEATIALGAGNGTKTIIVPIHLKHSDGS